MDIATPEVRSIESRISLPALGSAAARILLPLLGVAIAIALWWWYSSRNPLTAPAPDVVWDDIKNNFFDSGYLASHGVAGGEGYWYDLVYTAKNVFVGVAIGTVLGVGLGLLSVPWRFLGEIINPLAATFGSAPIFIAAPFFLIWFGIVSTAQILMVSFYTTLLMYIFARRAADNVPAEYVESAAVFGAQKQKIFRLVYVPACVPELIGGFRVALAGAWGLEAIAELLGAQQGMGFLITFFAQTYSIEKIMAITIILGITALVFDALTMVGARALVRWTSTGRSI